MSQFDFNAEYVRKLAAGDRETQQHFTNHFTPILRIKLRTKLRSFQMIEDVRQDTFLRVLEKVRENNGIHIPERLGAFVNAVCNNVMMEYFRDNARNRQMPEEIPEIIDDTADPSQNITVRERRRLVADILAELSAKDRSLLMQVFFEERNKEQICREMNVTSEYLRVLIHRAKARFRAILDRVKNDIH
jgi:RNA polymerase sigma-70 factor (ECF subfamily)